MEILSIITERPDRLALRDVGRLPTKHLEHRQEQPHWGSQSTWTTHYSEQRWKRREVAWFSCGLWMSLQLFQHEILSSHASVIRPGPVTCTWYLSLIGHSLFTGIVTDAVLHGITSAKVKTHSQWKWQLSASGTIQIYLNSANSQLTLITYNIMTTNRWSE